MEHEAAHALVYLKEALIFLVAAGVVVPVLQRLGLNPILGYLVAGVAVGPHGLVALTDSVLGVPTETFAIPDSEGVRGLAELGVVFLLFLIGLELSGPRLWAMRRLVFGLGGGQVLLTTLAIAGVGYAVGLGPEAAVAAGACLALSSTAIVVQLLVATGRFGSPTGQATFAVLLAQDIAVVPVLLVISSFGTAADDVARSLVFSLASAALIIPAILIVGRRVLGPLLRFIGARQDRDMFTAAALLVIVGTAFATSQAGLSMALGAFLAGLIFADTEFSHQLEAEIAPFKGLLLGLFFLSVGMTVDPTVLVDAPLTLLAVVAGVIAIKAVVVIAVALVARLPLAVAVESGLLLSQIGEFSLVGLALAASLGVIPADAARILVLAAGITMALTSATAGPVHRLAEWIAARRRDGAFATTLGESEAKGHVIVAGFGRIGQAIGAMLEARHVPYIALDLDSRSVARARKAGKPVYFGDVRRADVLANANAKAARAVVLTMDSPGANAAAIQSLRQLGIAARVVVRARDAANAGDLYGLGADEVVLEAFEASLQMGEETLVAIGFPREAAHAMIAERRETGRRELADAAEARRR